MSGHDDRPGIVRALHPRSRRDDVHVRRWLAVLIPVAIVCALLLL